MEGILLLVVGAILLAALIGAFAASRSGVPLLIVFLGLGMVLGSEGPGGIPFDDPEVARAVGVVGLVAILFEGGLTTAWRGLQPVLLTASLLGTVGVAVTAVLTGLAGIALFDLDTSTGLLLGAVVASTDAAAVFATLRFTTLRRRVARVLEAESGVNDPAAVALTVGLIGWIEGELGPAGFGFLLVSELGLGLVFGVILGLAASWAFGRMPDSMDPFVAVASVATAALSYGLTDVLHGSGFLAVYVVGLFVGNTHTPFRHQIVSFHQGLAFVAQVGLFVALGLLVFPSELGPVVLPGLALTLVLLFVARPVAVWVSTIRQGFTVREQALIGWAGLRGAVPIVLATFAQSEAVEDSDTIFNVVFFVVLVSALLQGTTLEPVARRLGLVRPSAPAWRPPIEVGAARGLERVEFSVNPGDVPDGKPVRELGLPRQAIVAVIVRDGDSLPPRGSTVVRAGDELYLLLRPELRDTVEQLFADWRSA
ncbi:MAG TPA: potassium/proton antiporter [Gaiellaceae bacterium]|nr:potassium/proton antiporter [Gaiellaceae bacterium]